MDASYDLLNPSLICVENSRGNMLKDSIIYCPERSVLKSQRSLKSQLSQGSSGINFMEMKKKLTNDYQRIKSFEGREKSRKTSRVSKVDFMKTGGFKLFLGIKEEEEMDKEIDKEVQTIMQIDNDSFVEDQNKLKLYLNESRQEREFNNETDPNEQIKQLNKNFNKISSNKDDKKQQKELIITPNEEYRISVLDISSPNNLVIPKDNSPGGEKRLLFNLHHNSSSTINGDQSRGNKKNILDLNKHVRVPDKKLSNFTDYTGINNLTENRTLDYSDLEDDKSASGYSPVKILRKFNVNPYHNFNVVKKYFIYQLKKSFLQAKKYMFTSNVHGKEYTGNRNTNYHEIFTNYSQISSTTVTSYVKYEDRNIKINNYYVHKNKILGKGGFSTVYVCRNLKDGKEYVIFNK